MRLRDRIAVVTGASRGIGAGIALAYAREGADVVIVSRHADGSDEVARQVEQLGQRALPLAADVSRAEDVAAALDATLTRFGRVDILVNNAGINIVKPSLSLSLAEWEQVIGTNLTGAFLWSQAVGRGMVERGSGVIINIASMASFLAYPERLAYSASKGGIVMLTRVLASEWGPRGVRVNAIAPGMINTDIQRRLVAEGRLDPARIARRTPLGRRGEVDDLTGPAVFLASDEAAFMTGETLVVDGGWLWHLSM